jgi:DNA invertase Pin-like site-specific DNA recombinase
MAPRRNGRATAVATVTVPVRCVSYGRVSTETQADQEFNSIDAQIQACETYVNLHRDEGWGIGEHYSDAGYSGSNTNRPDLRRLIADIEVGKVDVVVVYKFDRLSRSMLDFLQLLDFFKRHNVSFVSVSQRFDTSTPVGEMTLNILLSFAQFEPTSRSVDWRDATVGLRLGRRGRRVVYQ